MTNVSTVLAILLFASTGWAQDTPKKYHQGGSGGCNEMMTFCWYGAELVSDPQVIAYGNRWVSQDKDEKPLEWITQVRCVQTMHTCIVARNQKVLGGGTRTETDLYHIESWSEYEIRAIGENDFARGKECEIDSLLLNRGDASVSVLSAPGPAAKTKHCMAILKPNTVMYRLKHLSKPKQSLKRNW